MSHFMLVVPMVFALAAPGEAPPSSSDQRAFEAARAEAGDDPARLIKLSFWCEGHGLRAERQAVLEQAVRADPDNASARGLLAQVRFQGRWETPEAVHKQIQDDAALAAKLAEYNARRKEIYYGSLYEGRRARRRRIAAENVEVALWCEENGLKGEAEAHFTTALQFNPYHEATWRHLGYVKHRGRWMAPGQITAEAHEELLQKQADRRWGASFQKWMANLNDRDPQKRERAEKELEGVSDPRAVPTIARWTRSRDPVQRRWAVRLLEQIDTPSSSRRLAALALEHDDPMVRETAAAALKGREPRDWAERLVNVIRAPMTYQVQPVAGPGTQGALVVDSPRFKITRTYKSPAAFRIDSTFYGYMGYDANGLPLLIRGRELSEVRRDLRHGRVQDAKAEIHGAEVRTIMRLAVTQALARLAKQRLAADVREIESLNARAVVLDERAETALRAALGAPKSLGFDDENGWRAWYYEKIGYRYTPPPKVVAAVNAVPTSEPPEILSCFAAGTPVHTREGIRPIESVRVGDQLLGRDTTTGALAFQPVLAIHHNPPDKTLKITLENGDSVVASRFHRFWRAGLGWAMARDLKTGEVLRTLEGPSPIRSIEAAPVQPVFNFDVAGFRTFFVGRTAMLVHDNRLPDPRATAPPFDLASNDVGRSSIGAANGPGVSPHVQAE